MNEQTIDHDTAIAVQEPFRLPAAEPIDDSGSILAVIRNIASDKEADIERLKMLYDLYKTIKADKARATFFTERAKIAPKLPTIPANGRLIVRKKEGGPQGEIIQNTPYPIWADINEAITPILGEHGFTLWFKLGAASDGKINVTCILSHEHGHFEDMTLPFPYDSTGSKNNIQAEGSAISYGKRYLGCAMLNISSRTPIDIDDDGKAAGQPSNPMSAEQVDAMRHLIVATGANVPNLCAWINAAYRLNIDRPEALPAKHFDPVMAVLRMKQLSAKVQQ